MDETSKQIRYKKEGKLETIAIQTQAGKLMLDILEKLEKQVDYIFFSFDVDSINSAYCPGVSAPSVVGGLNYNQSLELCLIAGAC